jgi:cell wall-associated NlpC family hydrolase
VSLRFDQLVVAYALQQLGRPYIWAGNGEWAVRPVNGVMQKVPMQSLGCAVGFDCVGLVKCGVLAAGGPDLRDWWSAEHLWALLPDVEPTEGADWNRLVFYGDKATNRASHIELDLGRGVTLGAAGGDSHTLTATDALARPAARVQVRHNTRTDVLGTRSLAACARLPLRPA